MGASRLESPKGFPLRPQTDNITIVSHFGRGIACTNAHSRRFFPLPFQYARGEWEENDAARLLFNRKSAQERRARTLEFEYIPTDAIVVSFTCILSCTIYAAYIYDLDFEYLI